MTFPIDGQTETPSLAIELFHQPHSATLCYYSNWAAIVWEVPADALGNVEDPMLTVGAALVPRSWDFSRSVSFIKRRLFTP